MQKAQTRQTRPACTLARLRAVKCPSNAGELCFAPPLHAAAAAGAATEPPAARCVRYIFFRWLAFLTLFLGWCLTLYSRTGGGCTHVPF